jgi:hypothetical protein
MNAALDGKESRQRECEAARAELERAGLHALVADYARRLAILETGRPQPGGDASRFAAVRSYREGVVRLSLGVLSTACGFHGTVAEGAEGTDVQEELDVLFRMVMLCQIIDDVADYAVDRAGDLPGFATACRGLVESLRLTRLAASEYAMVPPDQRVGPVVRGVLWLMHRCTAAAIYLRRVPRQVYAIISRDEQ